MFITIEDVHLERDFRVLEKILRNLNEKYSNVWVLLSDTDRFLSRANLMLRYEKLVRNWRHRISESRNSYEVHREVRNEIINFRRQMRSQGWELRLGSLDVQLKGFRQDDAVIEGFMRMVLWVSEVRNPVCIVGSANHLELSAELEARHLVAKSGVLKASSENDVSVESEQSEQWGEERRNFRQGYFEEETHYLWYRRIDRVIELAGSDSETRDAYARLSLYILKHKSDLVRLLHKT